MDNDPLWHFCRSSLCKKKPMIFIQIWLDMLWLWPKCNLHHQPQVGSNLDHWFALHWPSVTDILLWGAQHFPQTTYPIIYHNPNLLMTNLRTNPNQLTWPSTVGRRWSSLVNGTPCNFRWPLTIGPSTIDDPWKLLKTLPLMWKLWWCGMTHGYWRGMTRGCWCAMTCHHPLFSIGHRWSRMPFSTLLQTHRSPIHWPSTISNVTWLNFNTFPNSLIPNSLAIDDLRCHLAELQYFTKLINPRSIGHRRY